MVLAMVGGGLKALGSYEALRVISEGKKMPTKSRMNRAFGFQGLRKLLSFRISSI